jgi:hypothetical protein
VAINLEDAWSSSESGDQLEGPNGWEPTLKDLAPFSISHIVNDLPFNPELGNPVAQTAREIVVQGLLAAQQSMQSIELRHRTEVPVEESSAEEPVAHILAMNLRVQQGLPGPSHSDAVPKLDLDHFKVRVLLAFSHLLIS